MENRQPRNNIINISEDAVLVSFQSVISADSMDSFIQPLVMFTNNNATCTILHVVNDIIGCKCEQMVDWKKIQHKQSPDLFGDQKI